MEPKKIKNPTGMLIMHGTVIAVVLYMAGEEKTDGAEED